MKNIKLFNILIIIALLFSTSCKKEIEFDGSETEPQPVMNILVSGGDTIASVKLTMSKFFLSSDIYNYPSIDDASVTMTLNGTEYPLTLYKDGLYTFLQNFHEGDMISFKAELSSGTILSTPTLTIPQKEKIYSAELKRDEDAGDYIELKFSNNRDAENFYQVLIYKNDNTTPAYVVCYDEAAMVPIGEYQSNNYGSRLLFPDLCMRDDTCTLNIHIVTDVDFLNKDLDTYVIKLETLDKDLYQYYTTMINSDSYSSTSFTEPVQVFCNITGGLGIFGLKSVSSIKITE